MVGYFLPQHDLAVADLDPQRIEEHHRVHRFNRATLLG